MLNYINSYKFNHHNAYQTDSIWIKRKSMLEDISQLNVLLLKIGDSVLQLKTFFSQILLNKSTKEKLQ